jgi:hypothetical protein
MDYVEIEGVIEHETDLAVLVSTGDDDPVWIPKSLINLVTTEKDGSAVLEVAEWFAVKEGMV